MGKIEKIRIWTKKFLAIFYKKWFFQNHTDKDSFLRNEYEIFSSGTSIWYLKICDTDFWISDCFWKMADCVHVFEHFANSFHNTFNTQYISYMKRDNSCKERFKHLKRMESGSPLKSDVLMCMYVTKAKKINARNSCTKTKNSKDVQTFFH